MKKLLSNLVNFIVCFSMMFAIAMMIIVYIGSVRYLLPILDTNPLNERLFYFGILIAITSGFMHFFEMFLKEFTNSFKSFGTDTKEVK